MTVNRAGLNSTMASVSDSEFRQMKKFMNDSCFTCTDEWLLACMNWIKENSRLVSFDVWKRELSEQWKDANLEEMESSCFTQTLSTQRLVKLPGKYGLQVNSVRDIGESSYSQWTKLKKLENENVTVAATDSNEYTPTWQPTPKRCLYLTMTDGSQTVFGLEMQPIPGLTLSMKPGFKVIILGPVDCRRGVFHLKPNNIRVIGGEVEDLLQTNRMEKILAEALKLDSSTINTQQPTTQSLTGTSSNTAGRSRNQNNRAPTAATVGGEEISGDFPDSEDPFPDIGADDDIFMEIDEEALLRSVSNSSTAIARNTTSASSRINNQATNDEIEDFEDDFIDNVDNVSHVARSSVSASLISGSNSTSSTSPASLRKPKPLFVPPIIRPQSSISSRRAVDSDEFPSGANAPKPKLPSNSASQKVERASCTTGFKSAKSALNSKSGKNSKQKNILEFLKPMPVVIDPPTPERQVKRRRKSEEQSNLASDSKLDHGVSSFKEEKMLTDENMEPANESPGPQVDVNMEEDYQASIASLDADDSLMRIVDETLESKLLESDTPEPCSSRSSTKATSRKTYPIAVSESPYIYLAQVHSNIDILKKKRKVVYVKACVSTVVSNIQVDNGCWTLCVCINDGTAYLNCNISANILTGIIGFTPSEMKKLKAEKTKEGKQKIAEGMRSLANTLVHLNAVFAVELGELPMITEIIDLKLNHSAALKSRLYKLAL